MLPYDAALACPLSGISNVRNVQGEGIVQSKLFVGVQHTGNLLHDFPRSLIIFDPFPHPHATGMVRVSQSIGIDVDEKMIVGMDFWILQDLFSYGALERLFHLTG